VCGKQTHSGNQQNQFQTISIPVKPKCFFHRGTLLPVDRVE
jgi:hypothetical protein